MKVATGFLVSYDYMFLYHALPLVYPHADKIVLTIDSQLTTLTGEPFEVEAGFFSWVQQLDIQQKISWLQQPFYQKEWTAAAVILSMRNAMLQAMQPADWYVQLDADEYFLDFAGFAQFLRQRPPTSTVEVIQCYWKTMFKQVPGGYLFIGGQAETVPVAINTPVNTAERSHKAATVIQSPFYMLHQSWARPVQDIAKKVRNWSHCNDFDTAAFFRFWQQINHRNYQYPRYFHPLHAPLWPYLEKVQAGSIPALIEHYRKQPPTEQPAPALSWAQKLMKKWWGI